MAGARDIARDRDRVVTAIMRHVDLGIGPERRAVALIVKAPGHAAMFQFEVFPPEFRHPIGEVGDGVIAVDGKPGIVVGDDLFGGRGVPRLPSARREHAAEQTEQEQGTQRLRR